MKVRYLATIAASFILGAYGMAKADDQWFVLGEAALLASNPSVEIQSSGGRWEKDVKKVKLQVEGGDVEISNLVLHWDNRPDDEIKDVGLIKSGGETAPKDAPGRKGRLKGVTLAYKIQGDTAHVVLKVLGFD